MNKIIILKFKIFIKNLKLFIIKETNSFYKEQIYNKLIKIKLNKKIENNFYHF